VTKREVYLSHQLLTEREQREIPTMPHV